MSPFSPFIYAMASCFFSSGSALNKEMHSICPSDIKRRSRPGSKKSAKEIPKPEQIFAKVVSEGRLVLFKSVLSVE